MSDSTVDLWLCPVSELDDNGDVRAQLQRWLTYDEIAKVNRYRMDNDRIKALYVRCFLRAILSRYATRSPDSWRFEYGDKGKPRLSGCQYADTGIEFNISHSRDYLLVAIYLNKSASSSIALGVDIEHARHNTNIKPIMTRYFSNLEIVDLVDLDGAQQHERFFDLWALKESYIKATGKGLATSLKSFAFDFSEAEELVVLMRTCNVDSEEYRQLRLYQGIELQIMEGGMLEEQVRLDSKPVIIHSHLCWQSLLGRLDDQYRFAVTLGGENLTGIKLNINELCISDLLDQFNSTI